MGEARRLSTSVPGEVGAAVHPPTLVDVALLAGVSRSTASNVLNHPEQVAPRTRSQVEEAVAALGFVRNEAARHLRSTGGRADPGPGGPGVGIVQVAAAARVSLGTVSNVVNRPHLVGPVKRRRVEAAIADLGWVADESARRLRQRVSAQPVASPGAHR